MTWYCLRRVCASDPGHSGCKITADAPGVVSAISMALLMSPIGFDSGGLHQRVGGSPGGGGLARGERKESSFEKKLAHTALPCVAQTSMVMLRLSFPSMSFRAHGAVPLSSSLFRPPPLHWSRVLYMDSGVLLPGG